MGCSWEVAKPGWLWRRYDLSGASPPDVVHCQGIPVKQLESRRNLLTKNLGYWHVEYYRCILWNVFTFDIDLDVWRICSWFKGQTWEMLHWQMLRKNLAWDDAEKKCTTPLWNISTIPTPQIATPAVACWLALVISQPWLQYWCRY